MSSAGKCSECTLKNFDDIMFVFILIWLKNKCFCSKTENTTRVLLLMLLLLLICISVYSFFLKKNYRDPLDLIY